MKIRVDQPLVRRMQVVHWYDLEIAMESTRHGRLLAEKLELIAELGREVDDLVIDCGELNWYMHMWEQRPDKVMCPKCKEDVDIEYDNY